MSSEHSVANTALAAGLTGRSWYRDEVGSTNTELIGLAREGAPAWSVFVAGYQSAGRGRLGRAWEATPGSSLMASLLLRPRIPPADAPLITLAAGACLAAAIEDACGVTVGCKWPNDLVAGERKLGGILTEAEVAGDRLAFVVIGTGVNVRQRPEDLPPGLEAAATSVAIEGGRTDPDALLRAYLERFRTDFDPDGDDFARRTLATYREWCLTLGRRVRATTTDGRRAEGLAEAVGDRGQLVVQTPEGLEEIGFGEVEHLR
jgi:BirA family transcriptional regulator, biotin operon repressor / biotin---[acetyl-CoA-carboxylase] ligase